MEDILQENKKGQNSTFNTVCYFIACNYLTVLEISDWKLFLHHFFPSVAGNILKLSIDIKSADSVYKILSSCVMKLKPWEHIPESAEMACLAAQSMICSLSNSL